MTPRTLGLTAALALTLTACAGGPPDGPRRGPPPGEDGPGPRGDGQQLFISPAGEPFRAAPDAPYPVATWFAGADANHDGALTRDEFVADALRFFAVVDADHDGVIDGFEVSAYEQRIAPEIIGGAPPSMRRGPMGQGPGGGDGPPGGGRGGGGPPGGGPPGGGKRGGMAGNALQGASLYGLIAEPQPVMGADADFNRRITKDEATKAAVTRFKLLDTDKDGLLKLETLPKTPDQQRAEDGKSRSKDGDGPKRPRGRR